MRGPPSLLVHCKDLMYESAVVNPLLVGLCRDDSLESILGNVVDFCATADPDKVTVYTTFKLPLSEIRPENRDAIFSALGGHPLGPELIDTAARCAVDKYRDYEGVGAPNVWDLSPDGFREAYNSAAGNPGPLVTWDDTQVELDVLLGRERAMAVVAERANNVTNKVEECAVIPGADLVKRMNCFIDKLLLTTDAFDPASVRFAVGKAREGFLPLMRALARYSQTSGAVITMEDVRAGRTETQLRRLQMEAANAGASSQRLED